MSAIPAQVRTQRAAALGKKPDPLFYEHGNLSCPNVPYDNISVGAVRAPVAVCGMALL